MMAVAPASASSSPDGIAASASAATRGWSESSAVRAVQSATGTSLHECGVQSLHSNGSPNSQDQDLQAHVRAQAETIAKLSMQLERVLRNARDDDDERSQCSMEEHSDEHSNQNPAHTAANQMQQMRATFSPHQQQGYAQTQMPTHPNAYANAGLSPIQMQHQMQYQPIPNQGGGSKI